ncbi:unnamed protein product [Citrullus colocynthis]|uniref:Uncharacterized protein n=1 Tax=Citrullus colocynthis TaxID=252529 RepID=A0ABP0XWH6_9ROSI
MKTRPTLQSCIDLRGKVKWTRFVSPTGWRFFQSVSSLSIINASLLVSVSPSSLTSATRLLGNDPSCCRRSLIGFHFSAFWCFWGFPFCYNNKI